MAASLKTLLDSFAGHYAEARGVGHTKLVIDAVLAAHESKVVPLVVCVNEAHATHIRDEIAKRGKRPGICRIITLDNAPGRLLGSTEPLIFDNHTLARLFDKCLRVICGQRRTIAELASALGSQARESNEAILGRAAIDLTEVPF